MARKWRHHLKWGLIHAALVLFFADLLGCFWPAFEEVWSGRIAHIGVALAAFVAELSEYVTEDVEAAERAEAHKEGKA
jgi:hypothetical protein